MKSSNRGTDEEALREMYRSAVRASYFGGLQNQDFLKKSRMQLNNIAKEEG